MENALTTKNNLIADHEKDIELLHERLRNEIESLEASYENKIMQLSIKIKK